MSFFSNLTLTPSLKLLIIFETMKKTWMFRFRFRLAQVHVCVPEVDILIWWSGPSLPSALLLSDVTKIFLFRSRLRFSTLPSLSMSISLCFADATKFSCLAAAWDLAPCPHFHYLPNDLLHHQVGDRKGKVSNIRWLRDRKIGSGILNSSVRPHLQWN